MDERVREKSASPGVFNNTIHGKEKRKARKKNEGLTNCQRT